LALAAVRIFAPTGSVVLECERILRTLSSWFGIESALVDYAKATATYPIFVTDDGDGAKAFISLRRHSLESWEIHRIAVDAAFRNKGIGRELLDHAEEWLRQNAAAFLQVKTLAATHDSPAYAETRKFYSRVGFAPLEVHPNLWGPRLPVLQLIKAL
jgi:GNAT superfamily N-acetyltransferase